MQVKNLSVYYGDACVVDDVSFSLFKGGMCALLGPNAGGKTTLLKGICRLVPTKGECIINGKKIANMRQKQLARHISYIPQNSSIELAISVLDVVMMGFSPMLSLLENPGQSHREMAIKALSDVGLSDKADTNFLHLSAGQKQLAVFARALVQNTPLMLLDEPDSALDFANKHHILNMIQKITKKQNKSVLISLHDANMALQYCDRALLLSNGKLIADIDFSTVSNDELKEKLSLIYTPVEIIQHNNHKVMLKKSSD